MDLDELLRLALTCADAADRITTERFRAADLVVETKPDMTPVSEADVAVETAIRDLIRGAGHDHVIVGEEHGEDGSDERVRWIIDPIDATKNFVRGVPVFATLIGVEVDGAMAVGVVSAPALGARWWAASGRGAFRDGEPIRVSAVRDLADAQLTYAWDYSFLLEWEGLGDRIEVLSRQCWRTRSFGDFWQHMLVADGGFDISIEPVGALWDLAPLEVIVTEAGGRMTDLHGRPGSSHGSALITNGVLHDAALAALGFA